MSESIPKPNRPQDYGPKKTPEILTLAAESAEFIVKGEPATQPQILQKELTLVGAEADITDWSNFEPILNSLYEKVNANLGNIQIIEKQPRMVGFWHMGKTDHGDTAYRYFAGVEAEVDQAPDGLIVKTLPQSLYAVFKEERRGQIGGAGGYGYQWLRASEKYQENGRIPGDFEIYTNMVDTGAECEAKI